MKDRLTVHFLVKDHGTNCDADMLCGMHAYTDSDGKTRYAKSGKRLLSTKNPNEVTCGNCYNLLAMEDFKQ